MIWAEDGKLHSHLEWPYQSVNRVHLRECTKEVWEAFYIWGWGWSTMQLHQVTFVCKKLEPPEDLLFMETTYFLYDQSDSKTELRGMVPP